MKRNDYKLSIYLPTLAVLLVSAVVLRTVAIFRELNFKTGFYGDESMFRASAWIVLAASVFFLTYFIVAKNEEKPIAEFSGPATYIPSGLVSVALLFMTAELFGEFMEEERKLSASLSSNLLPHLTNVFTLLVAAAALLSIANFFFNSLFEKNENLPRAAFGLIAIVFFAAYAVHVYFTSPLPINSPNKAIDQMAYLFTSLFFIYEIRISLARAKWRAYVVFGLIAAILTGYSSLPALIVYFAEGEIISKSIAEIALTLALFIYITSRLILTSTLIGSTPSKIALAIEALAEKREERMLNGVEPDTNEDDETEEETEERNYTFDLDESEALAEDVTVPEAESETENETSDGDGNEENTGN